MVGFFGRVSFNPDRVTNPVHHTALLSTTYLRRCGWGEEEVEMPDCVALAARKNGIGTKQKPQCYFSFLLREGHKNFKDPDLSTLVRWKRISISTVIYKF